MWVLLTLIFGGWAAGTGVKEAAKNGYFKGKKWWQL